MKNLSNHQERYLRLAAGVAEAWPPAFSACCSACKKICCRPHMGQEIIESSWLSALGEMEYPDWMQRPGDPHGGCAALGPRGCIFTAAKPPFCTAFYCDAMVEAIADPLQLLGALFLSTILKDACGLGKHLNLQEMTPKAIEDNLDLLDRAMARGEDNLALYQRFKTHADLDLQYRDVLLMLCRMPALLTTPVTRKLRTILV